MKGIAKHISDLLFHHDCVIIPGLGGLVANPVPACYDEGKNMFFPAGKEIGFNRNLKHNDGLLINHIAKTESISYEDAKNRVNDFVETTTQRLKNSEVVSLGNAGELRVDAGGAVLFTPNTTENFLTDSFGLSSFHFSPSATYQHHNFSTRKIVRRTIKPLNTKYIAAAAIAIGLFVFSPEVKNPGVNRAGGLEILTTNENIGNVSSENKETSSIAIDISTAAKESVQPEEKKITLNYFIITGSFKRIDQADKYCKQLNTNGQNNPLILKSPKGRFRVAIEGFSSKEEALTSLSVYRSKKGFNSAWILTQKQ
jgi:nucleoid DNA-binding protein